ncbi:Oidioi.mRNA.OKI2018_I69.XSR.g16024.t1.cds [Oikopleura dioica]|uniref:Oidioi.mRNA.OKI2018_I69.XSR.g16024.t1.cds n=1 Tax=Oikopleura dioica TaxID=34765 RepID=A0ABN7SJU9_OIKDI|nr:Oidioi.mRNA.OKI2018_I69.XSR.g16024.t1.cds [Oikopleura dioica]
MDKMQKSAFQTSSKVLLKELKGLITNPLEGFHMIKYDEKFLYEWEIGVFGPPKTLYEGGYFPVKIRFPKDYPYKPPIVRFTTPMFHPNVYADGAVCISILHSPVNDPMSGELASERWSPSQSVRSVLLSIVSLLNEPNTSSPANVDASVLYGRYKRCTEKKKAAHKYAVIIKQQVEESRKLAIEKGIEPPVTIDDYVSQRRSSSSSSWNQSMQSSVDEDDEPFYNDDDSEADISIPLDTSMN